MRLCQHTLPDRDYGILCFQAWWARFTESRWYGSPQTQVSRSVVVSPSPRRSSWLCTCRRRVTRTLALLVRLDVRLEPGSPALLRVRIGVGTRPAVAGVGVVDGLVSRLQDA